MNKEQAISRLSQITEDSKVLSEKHLEAFLQLMEECVENKDSLKMVGHFTMEVVERAERNGRNPQTKEPMTIPATKAVRVKIGKKLKDLAKQ